MFPGLRVTGPPLFSSVDLERYEFANFYSVVDEHLGNIAKEEAAPDRDILLATFAEYSCTPCNLRLGQPSRPSFVSGRYKGQELCQCVVPYRGDRFWFYFSASTSLAMQPAHGVVGPDSLILRVEVDEAYREWAPVALAAELERIRANIELLARMPDHINKELLLHAEFMTEHMLRVWKVRSYRQHRSHGE
jgi:hypothetical protein